MNDKFIKFLLVFTALYFLVHIGYALADTVLINQPDGKQTICVVVNNIIQCYWEWLSSILNEIKHLENQCPGCPGCPPFLLFFKNFLKINEVAAKRLNKPDNPDTFYSLVI